MKESELIYQVWDISQKILGPQFSLLLFGSRAKGTHRETSDFDFAIRGKSAVPSEKWDELKRRISELRTLYKVDLVDYYQIEDDFKNVIEKQFKEIRNGKI